MGYGTEKDRGQTKRKRMNTLKWLLAGASVIIFVGITSARADVLTEGKYELKEFKEEKMPAMVDGVKQIPTNTKTFLDNEIAKTKEFQKKGWADAKEQNVKLINGIKKFFTGLKQEADQ
jgi:galactokinase/mevalonate kinase-like predicted kinase